MPKNSQIDADEHRFDSATDKDNLLVHVVSECGDNV